MRLLTLLLAAACVAAAPAFASEPVVADAGVQAPAYDAELAARVGADDYGMRAYVLVILRTGPNRVPDGDARKAMFAGHMANMDRLAKEGKLVLAGPFGDNDAQWRGLFLFAVDDIEEARELTATDPVIVEGEMVADFYPWYGSAATMLLPDLHDKVAKQSP